MQKLKRFLVCTLLMLSLTSTEVFAAAAMPVTGDAETGSKDTTVHTENITPEADQAEGNATEGSEDAEQIPEEEAPVSKEETDAEKTAEDEIPASEEEEAAADAEEAALYAVQDVNTEYEIYPTPHKIAYEEDGFIVRPEVNVVYESTIDEATKNHLEKVLGLKDKTITVSKEKVKGKTNILVGTDGSGEYVDTYVNENHTVDSNLFAHFGAYYFATTNDEIVILGRDSDAAFYGITTLKQIFKQIDGSTLRHLKMEDYADVNIRGFIEGYYGMPWTNDDRMELMKFGGDIKMTSYIFAPKDDPYHKEKWREEYPADELERLKEMVDVGNATKCRFVWTAHPFMGGFDRNNADQEIQTLINKFEHLYTDAGVRQFGVLGDDVGNLPRSIVVKMMQEVSKWAKSKPDVYDIVFCPAGYNHSWQGNYSELNEYDAQFPDNVQIFWTGEAVCKPIEQTTLNHFRTHNKADGKRRAPLFWLNWPVNDINHSRMIMGHATSMLHTNINIDDLAGAVTNPMQESEPSKVAIFQLADYAWNVKGFNGQQSWKDSFKYIEPDAADELYTLAKHMSNPEPNGHGLVMPESEELAPKLNEFKTALDAGNVTTEQIDSMIAEFETIIEACDGFETKSQNAAMKEDLAPFVASMRDLCEANINFLKAKKTLDANDKLGAFNLYTAGQNELKASENHRKPMLGGGTEAVDPGSTALIPFAKKMESFLTGPMSDFIAGGEGALKITASSSFTSFYAGAIGNIIDGKNNTHAWYGGEEAAGQYYQVNYSIPQTIYGVHILNGSAAEGKARDTFGTGKVMYQVKDSQEWKQLGELFTDYPERVDITEIEIENVTAVRYECHAKGSSNKWPSMREFGVSLKPENPAEFTKTVIHTPTHWVASNDEKAKMVDENPATYTHFAVRNTVNENKDSYVAGDYFGVKLSKTVTLGKIDILQGRNDNDNENDYFSQSKLQYSLDGTKWNDIEGATELTGRHIRFDASALNIKAQYVRLVARNTQKNWVAVREFDVDSKVFYNAKAYTNVEDLKTWGANVLDESAELSAKDNITLEAGQYVGLKLDRIREILSITKTLTNGDGLTLETGKNEYEFTAYTEGTAKARYIRLINNTDSPITFNLQELSLTSKEFYPKSFVSADSDFTIYQPNETPATNLFDEDWTTQVIFQGSQSLGRHFVYDLGQVVDIEKLKVVCRDSEHDFPRHGKISVSTDKQTWTTVMELGNQNENNPGEATNEDEIKFVLPNHETSYNTKEVTLESAAKGRYIKFEITRAKAGNDKWVRFQEFIINDGKYIPSVNDPTYEATVEETKNGQYAYLCDGDLATGFIPAKDSGKLTYHVSGENENNLIKIVQVADPISHAVVKARILKADKTKETITLGTLSQTVNEFVLPQDTKVLDVTIEWSNVTPIINELILSKKEGTAAVDKAALEALLNDPQNTEDWTKASKAAYDKAFANGSKVKESAHVTQDTVDAAVKAIETAIAGKELKGDVAVLQQKLDNKVTNEKLYTVSSWRNYQAVIKNLTAAIADAENTTVQEVEKLAADYDKALEALVYSPLKSEEAVLASEDENEFIGSVEEPAEQYTVNSWKAYTDAVKALEALVEENETTKVNPTVFQEKLDAVKAAKAGLVSIVNLVTLLNEFDETDASLYVPKTYEAYQEAAEAGKALKTDGTAEQIAEAIRKITEAKKALVLVGNVESVQGLLKELESLKAENYTKDSFKAVTDAIAEVKNLGALDQLSKEQLEEAAAALTDAKNALVSVEALNKIAAKAGTYEEKKYTKDSYKALKEALKPVEQLRINGTDESVRAAADAIELAIRNLKERASEDFMKQYINGIKFDNQADAYTEQSYKAYKDAYDRLIALSKNPENTTNEEFCAAVESFETAQKQLTKKPAATPQPQPQPQPQQQGTAGAQGTATGDTAPLFGLGLALLVSAAGIILLRKKYRREQ